MYRWYKIEVHFSSGKNIWTRNFKVFSASAKVAITIATLQIPPEQDDLITNIHAEAIEP